MFACFPSRSSQQGLSCFAWRRSRGKEGKKEVCKALEGVAQQSGGAAASPALKLPERLAPNLQLLRSPSRSPSRRCTLPAPFEAASTALVHTESSVKMSIISFCIKVFELGVGKDAETKLSCNVLLDIVLKHQGPFSVCVTLPAAHHALREQAAWTAKLLQQCAEQRIMNAGISFGSPRRIQKCVCDDPAKAPGRQQLQQVMDTSNKVALAHALLFQGRAWKALLKLAEAAKDRKKVTNMLMTSSFAILQAWMKQFGNRLGHVGKAMVVRILCSLTAIGQPVMRILALMMLTIIKSMPFAVDNGIIHQLCLKAQ